MPEERRPSNTVPIERRELLEAMLKRGDVVECPACHFDGVLMPKRAAKVRLALACIPPDDRETKPDLGEPDEP